MPHTTNRNPARRTFHDPYADAASVSIHELDSVSYPDPDWSLKGSSPFRTPPLFNRTIMTKCSYCRSTILFGGIREGEEKFCNEQCRNTSERLRIECLVPDEVVEQFVAEVHSGTCPRCDGEGPVDLHTSYLVHSVGWATYWRNVPQICCCRCARRAKVGGFFSSFFLGWYGIPWGLILTPVQMFRNLAGLLAGADPSRPSLALAEWARAHLAEQAWESSQQSAAPRPPRVGSESERPGGFGVESSRPFEGSPVSPPKKYGIDAVPDRNHEVANPRELLPWLRFVGGLILGGCLIVSALATPDQPGVVVGSAGWLGAMLGRALLVVGGLWICRWAMRGSPPATD